MIDGLTELQKELYSNIIFNNNEQAALLALRNISNPQDIANLKHIYDQKIAFEAAYVPLKPPKPLPQHNQQYQQSSPSMISTICFCLFPENNRELFDITNQIFIKRFFAVFLFWKKNFLSVGGGQADLYGPLWVLVIYISLMGLMGNLTVYMVDFQGFKFKDGFYASAFGTVVIFFIAQILFYPAILSCLGGFMLSKEAVCIIGYSIILYFIPTILCIFTSLSWYVTCMMAEGIVRAIFLFRNFSTRVEAKTYILLIVFLLVEILYGYVLLQVIFFKYSGYTFVEGINQLTSAGTVDPLELRVTPPTNLVAPVASHMFVLRTFIN